MSWNVPAGRARRRLRMSWPVVGAFAAFLFLEAVIRGSVTFGILGAAFVVLVVVLVALGKDRRFTLDGDGLTIDRRGGRTTRHPWARLAGYQSHEDLMRSSGRYSLGPRATQNRHMADEVVRQERTFGRTLFLRPASRWRLDITVETTPEVSQEVVRRVETRLPLRPGTRMSVPVVLIAIAVVALAVALAVLTT